MSLPVTIEQMGLTKVGENTVLDMVSGEMMYLAQVSGNLGTDGRFFLFSPPGCIMGFKNNDMVVTVPYGERGDCWGALIMIARAEPDYPHKFKLVAASLDKESFYMNHSERAGL